MEENIMDETTNNIIEQKEEEKDISRWEKEQLEKLILGSIKFAEQMGLSRKQYKRIVFKLWTDESSPKEEDEIIFRKKARHFFIRNREAFFEIEEYLQYYEDIAYLMNIILKEKRLVTRMELESEYISKGYEKRFKNFLVSRKILNKLTDTFYEKLIVNENDTVEVKKQESKMFIRDNNDFKEFRKKNAIQTGVVAMLAMKMTWAIEREEIGTI